MSVGSRQLRSRQHVSLFVAANERGGGSSGRFHTWSTDISVGNLVHRWPLLLAFCLCLQGCGHIQLEQRDGKLPRIVANAYFDNCKIRQKKRGREIRYECKWEI